MLLILKRFSYFLGNIIYYIFHPRIIKSIALCLRYVYSGYKSKSFKICPHTVLFSKPFFSTGEKYVELGDYVVFGANSTITAYKLNDFQPLIKIGSRVSFGNNLHLTAVNRIEIGNNCLFGKNILITDNSHGSNTIEELGKHPAKRKVVSKGPVIIREKVWVGDNVSILPGVTIGESSIIGASSVITKDIPPYSIVCGNPARVVKQLLG